MKDILKYVVLALSLAGIVSMMSCGSQKTVVKTEPNRVSTDSDVFRTLSIDKATFSLTMAGTDMNSPGTIRIARDSVIICTITPVVGMEFFRFVINKQGIIMINRVDKKFVSASFEEMKSKGIALNYQAFESIFTNRLFLYGENYFPLASDFKTTKSHNGSLQLLRTEGNVLQEFSYNHIKELVSGSLAIGSSYSTRWSYADFRETNGVKFPYEINFSIHSGAQNRSIGIRIDKLELDKDRNFEVKIPATYKQITMKEFLQTY